MYAAPASSEPPSLLAITVRRSFVSGRIYLGIGIAFSFIFALVLGAGGGGRQLVSIGALLIPIYAVMGGMGGLMVFTNDRIKGVLEYLVAYGVSPQRLFVNVLAACMVLVALVLAISLGAAVGISFAVGHPISLEAVKAIGLYTVPMGFAAVAFAATLGMFWTSISSPREGMSSPIGLVPIVGVAPPLFVLILVEGMGGFTSYAIPSGAVLALALAVVLMVRSMARLMPRERLLSPT